MAKRQPPQLPLKVPERDAILPMMQALIAEFDETLDAIVRTNTLESATFETIVRPWANKDNEMQGSWGMINSLKYYSPSLETQDMVCKALKMFGKAETRWALRDDYFRLLRAALAREKDNANLSQESRLYLEGRYKDYKQCGYGILSQSAREQYLEEQVKITGLSSVYTRNGIQESGGMWFEEKALNGVPVDELAKWNTDDSSPNERKRFVPFANRGAYAVLRYAHSEKVRRQMLAADGTKSAKNSALFNEIILRRSSQAHKLGFANHAEYRAPGRAFGSAANIHNFLEDFENDLVPIFLRELSELQSVRNSYRRLRGLSDEEGFYVSDRAYCHAIMLKALQVDDVLISEFFPLDHVLNAMLGLFTTFLGLRFDRVSDSDLDPGAKWHEDVEIFALWDCPAEGEEEADFLGYLYLDLLFRNHKYRNGQNVNLEKGYRKADGSRKYPSTILSCALPTPAPGTCKLLKHVELVHIFHELGHAMHDLLSKTEFGRFHGSNSLPVDATEIPTNEFRLFLENFVWVEDVLAKLGRHYTTLDVKYLDQWRKDNPGKPDPPRVDTCRAQSGADPEPLAESGRILLFATVSSALVCITSKYDMRLHSLGWQEGLKPLDVRKWCNGITLKDMTVNGCDYTTFSHLVNGYDVGFFGYLTCSAYAQDMWESEFAKDPWNRETWNRYRREILEHGNARPDLFKMVTDFLGRPARTEALINSLGKGTQKSIGSGNKNMEMNITKSGSQPSKKRKRS